MSTLKTVVESPYATSYLVTTVMLVVSFIVCKIFTIYDLDADLRNASRSNANIAIESTYATFHSPAKFCISVTVCEIITYEKKIESSTLKVKVENVLTIA